MPAPCLFAAALNEQGRFAATVVGDFHFLPVAGRHVWKGRLAQTAAELAEQVNGAMHSIIDFRDPFQTLEVVEVKVESRKLEVEIGDAPTEDSKVWALTEANRELLGVIAAMDALKGADR